MKKKPGSAGRFLTLTICILVILWGVLYILQWERSRTRIEQENARWSALYAPNAETGVSPSAAVSPTTEPTAVPETSAPTPAAAITDQATVSASQAPTASPTAKATPAPSSAPSLAASLAASTPEAAVDSTATPRATADSATLVYAMETPPPAQESFADLLSLNPETVGFLRIDDVLSLPVVQRASDNEFYLSHSFNLEESSAGTLFLDGSNLIAPEDDCLIVYGHNMRNGTMFRPLIGYEQLSFLKEHPLAHFDSIYENRVYAPFAVFTVTADAGNERYMNLRQFLLDGTEWEDYIAQMRALSMHEIPVDVAQGDHVLLLVTCEYTHNNGRFVVALRAQREGESEDALRKLVLCAQ